MNAKKLEQIIIVILLLVNLFLLGVVYSAGAQDRRSRRETEASLTALLAENGVEVGPGAVLLQDCPPECTVVRDMDREAERMRGLLGDLSAEDQGGSIWFYRSEQGQAVMHGPNNDCWRWDLQFLGTPESPYYTANHDDPRTGGNVLRGSDAKEAVTRFFSRAGVQLADVIASPDEEDGHLELCGCWNGHPVYNAVLGIDFSGERLYMVSGTMPFNVERSRDENAGMDSVSVLVRFVELARSEGFICSRIDALEAGYLMNVTTSGESTLTPVWRIATDTGDFYINAATGRSESPGGR